MPKWIDKIKRKLNLLDIPRDNYRKVPLGPISKSQYKPDPYTLEEIYGTNRFVTSRYVWYTFVFQNLYEQFQRVANFYFLCLAVIQLFTDAPVSPVISILPLVVVIFITMVKQGYEDYYRHKADNELNNAKIDIVSIDGSLKTIKSCQISIGDVIYCKNNHLFPCDMVLLTSSDENGDCYVTTANLDGETNLKRFRGVLEAHEAENSSDIANNLTGTVTCEEPVPDLYSFNGKINYSNESKSIKDKTLSLSADNVLLRGARLRNTDWVYGLAVYTGKDTKMSLNSQEKRTKTSRVEEKLNLVLVFILVFLIIVSLMFSIARATIDLGGLWYINLTVKGNAWEFVQYFLGHIVLFNYIIPISLYVTIEMVKFFSSVFFNKDILIYDPSINQPARANTSDILDDIGQIEYLFSDKTGTLTENLMVFRRFSIGKESYLFEKGVFKDSDSPQISPDHSPYIVPFIAILSLCHTVRVEMKNAQQPQFEPTGHKSKPFNLHLKRPKKIISREASRIRRQSAIEKADLASKDGKISERDFLSYLYQASSPDEKAFVEAAREFRIIYHGEDSKGFRVITVLNDNTYKYRVLDILEFDSDRKCMSIILQFVDSANEDSSTKVDPTQSVLILTKGAETAMLERISTKTGHAKYNSNEPIISGFFSRDLEWKNDVDEFNKIIDDYASLGLRTLVIGARCVSVGEWAKLSAQLNDARNDLEDKARLVPLAMRNIESDLILVGCTGIEDKLQEEVRETISDMKFAGINVWILTGDKEETAMNISYAASHFDESLEKIKLTKIKSMEEFKKALNIGLEKMNSCPDYGLVVDGQSLKIGLELIFRNDVMKLAVNSKAVLGCRLTPAQKADIVRLIKSSRSPAPITAAIGDGANDVSMILEAHVGFGLYGKEGRQAVRSADYAFAKFKFLRRVLFVHGFTFYIRITTMIKYFFYKNMVFTFCLMIYSFFNAFSTQTLFSEIYLLFYNLSMTALPIILYGIFEKPKPDSLLQKYPVLYSTLRSNAGFSVFNIIGWIFLGLYHSITSFFGTMFLSNFGDTTLAIGGLNSFGTHIVLCIFFIVTFKLMLKANSWNYIFIGSIVFTLVMNMIMFIFNNALYMKIDPQSSLLGTYEQLWTGSGCATTYFGIMIIITIALFPDFLMRLYSDYIWSKDIENVKNRTPVLQLMKMTRNIKRQYLSSTVGLENIKNVLRTMKPMNLSQSNHPSRSQDSYKYVDGKDEVERSELKSIDEHLPEVSEDESSSSSLEEDMVTHFNRKFRQESPNNVYRA